jgi:hypothetical protein
VYYSAFVIVVKYQINYTNENNNVSNASVLIYYNGLYAAAPKQKGNDLQQSTSCFIPLVSKSLLTNWAHIEFCHEDALRLIAHS